MDDVEKNKAQNKEKRHTPEFSDEKIQIPETEDNGFSLRKLWAFTGPGFIMSIIFLDPGNIESDLQSGAVAKYKLLWVLLSAIFLGLIMQRLSARLGVVTGLHLAEMCNRQVKKYPRILLWVMTEIAVIGSDMQEVIGTAIAIYLLSNKNIPLWAGVIITILDTFTFLFLDKYGLRKLEFIFACFIAIMAASFGYEYAMAAPPHDEVLKGMFVPTFKNWTNAMLLQAVGIIGTNIQPHNLYLYGALVKSRVIDRKQPGKVREANMYYFTEAAIAVFVSFLINVFVMSVFAQGLYGKTNADVYGICTANNFAHGIQEIKNNTDPFSADLYKGGVYLGCQYGFVAMIIWAIGILAAGQSSTMTGTYAGQFVMEGFLNLQWPRWRRVLFTRSLAILPALFVAIFSDIGQLTGMNDYLNVTMSLQLPFAALPLVAFTSSSNIMGEFRNGLFNKAIATALSLFVIGINTFLVTRTVHEITENSTYGTTIIVVVAFLAFFYWLFCIYLLIYLAIALGATSLNNYSFIAKYITGPLETNFELEHGHESN